ncbi:MAG: dihydrodipicolinate synthase family protein, partial [Alphaproteobacteria bacterium]|nr:dihydrodipicolinate synthase family protein [Alphaproteobacteria bacterium]
MTRLISEESKGVFVIMATPFADDGALDLQSADRLVEFCLEEGVHGFTLLGVMGEAPKLSLEEQAEFTDHVLKRIDGRVPVLVGVSNPGMDNLVALSKSAMDRGAGGVMVAGMPGLKTDEQVETYFQAVGDRLGEEIPVCLQDYPPTTTVFISVPVVNRLIAKLPQLKMFKHEDCPGHRKLTRLREAPETDGVRRVSILTGNNGLYVAQELARGADGIMTGFAFTGMLVEVYRLFESGRTEEAEDLFD